MPEGSGRYDVEREARRDLRVDPDVDVVRAERLDRLADLDPALVDVRAAGGTYRRDDVGHRDRAEQPTTGAGADLEVHRLRLELRLDLLGVPEIADLADLAGLLDRRDLLLSALGPLDGQASGDEVVAAVAVLDLDHVTGRTEVGDLV